MKYKASLDTLSKTITFLSFILIVVICYNSVKSIMIVQGNISVMWLHFGVILFLIVIFIGSYIYSPTAYTIDSDNLIIERPIKNKIIKLNSITELQKIEERGNINATRVFGVGGLFGYYGKYYDPVIGKMTFYTTKKRNRILIKTKQGQNIIISPDDMNIFNELNQLNSINL